MAGERTRTAKPAVRATGSLPRRPSARRLWACLPRRSRRQAAGRAGQRGGGEGCARDPRLSPWAKLCRPSADELTHAAHLGYRAPEEMQCLGTVENQLRSPRVLRQTADGKKTLWNNPRRKDRDHAKAQSTRRSQRKETSFTLRSSAPWRPCESRSDFFTDSKQRLRRPAGPWPNAVRPCYRRRSATIVTWMSWARRTTRSTKPRPKIIGQPFCCGRATKI